MRRQHHQYFHDTSDDRSGPSGDLEASRESLAKSHPNALMAVNLSRCSD
jgi:hypothetical protein